MANGLIRVILRIRKLMNILLVFQVCVVGDAVDWCVDFFVFDDILRRQRWR